MGMIRYNTLKAKKEKQGKAKQAKQGKYKARQTNELNFSVRNDSPKTRKPLHLPIQGLLSLKNGDYLLSHCYAVPSA